MGLFTDSFQLILYGYFPQKKPMVMTKNYAVLKFSAVNGADIPIYKYTYSDIIVLLFDFLFVGTNIDVV